MRMTEYGYEGYIETWKEAWGGMWITRVQLLDQERAVASRMPSALAEYKGKGRVRVTVKIEVIEDEL